MNNNKRAKNKGPRVDIILNISPSFDTELREFTRKRKTPYTKPGEFTDDMKHLNEIYKKGEIVAKMKYIDDNKRVIITVTDFPYHVLS